MAAFVLAWPGAIAIGLSLGLLGSGGSILFDDSLAESAAFADDLSQGLKSAIDEYILRETNNGALNIAVGYRFFL